MPTHSPDFKHFILSQYQPNSRSHGFNALSRFPGVGVSATTIENWYSSWDGTPQSLERKAGSGRPRVLTRAETAHQILSRVRAANRRHEAVHYTSIKPSIEAATGKSISLRTIQRYGREDAGIRDHRTKKRTVAERK